MISFLQNAFYFILLISVVVFIHEYGHYYFAKKYKVTVTDFSIGFGKELFGWFDKDGTRWKVCLIPLGGYVKFFGDSNSASKPIKLNEVNSKDHSKLLTTKPLYQRAMIVAAGPIANFILAILIFSLIFMIKGKDSSIPVIQEVQQESPAALAGLQSGDQISFINDTKIESIGEVSALINMPGSNLVKITVTRNTKLLDFEITPTITDGTDSLGNKAKRKMIGIKIAPLNNEMGRQRLGPAKAIYYAFKETYKTITLTLSYLGNVIIGSASPDQLGGPIKIAQITGQVAEYGIFPFLSIMAYISISLGLINLFPIPLLDGGHLFFYFIEFIRGKPLNEQVQEYFYRFGFFVLFTLMFFATFNDLKGLGLF
jgi:regulator of sigma E protease